MYQDASLLKSLLNLKETIKWSELLDGTKKTLDVVSQAIPIYYQVKPIVSNAKTLFKIANIVNTPNTNNNEIKKEDKLPSNNSPIFYL